MIFGPKIEPDHYYEEYINFKGDDDDFLQQENYCIFDETGLKKCTNCMHCEEKTFISSEQEYDEELL